MSQSTRERITRALAETPQDAAERPWASLLSAVPESLPAAVAELRDAAETLAMLNRAAAPSWEARTNAANYRPTVLARISRATVVIRLLAPVLVDQRGVRWTPTGQVRGADPLYVISGAPMDAPRWVQSTVAELVAAGLLLADAAGAGVAA